MAAEEKNRKNEERKDFTPVLFGPHMTPEESAAWKPAAIAGAVILLVVGAVIFGTNRQSESGPAAEDPYAANLQLSDLRLSAAQNLIGSTVSYIDGMMTNTGHQTVTAATVEAVFRNSLGEVVQREALPLSVLDRAGTYPDIKPLSALPLGPNQKHEFRLTLEHVSADWNHGYPEIRIIRVALQ